jgi:hypothetical protein
MLFSFQNNVRQMKSSNSVIAVYYSQNAVELKQLSSSNSVLRYAILKWVINQRHNQHLEAVPMEFL